EQDFLTYQILPCNWINNICPVCVTFKCFHECFACIRMKVICKNCLKYFPSTEQPKVAFSADLGMRGDLGPQSTEITLTFNNIFTNIGNNYNPATGLFTAPVKGVYYFRFTACGTQIQQSLGASLHKNGQKIVSVGQWRDHNQHRYASNGAVLQLEVGDVVCVKLLPGYTIYDSPDNLSTFSAIYIRYVM
uniref:Cerebellin 17 n=1 Tax=Cyprinus carpio TaxID=7962 RepID=A0A8C1MJ47_CYPCA